MQKFHSDPISKNSLSCSRPQPRLVNYGAEPRMGTVYIAIFSLGKNEL